MRKFDYKKDNRDFYLPKSVPTIVEIPAMTFAAIRGAGNPNEDAFAEVTAALYSLSYAVKMSYKSDRVPENYYEYTVFPLEGIWDLVDYSKPSTDKDNLAYQMMIRQPDFLTTDEFEYFKQLTQKKKPNPSLERIELISINEGLCCQMLHVGSYDDEPESFRQMEAYCEANGYERLSKIHREIYLSDPRKTETSKLKTVLRIHVRKYENMKISENQTLISI